MPAPFSIYTFAVLVTVMAASLWVLAWLMNRWTVGRRRERLRLWAARHGLVATETLPEFLGSVVARPRVVAGFASHRLFVGMLRTATTPASRTPASPAVWNVLAVRHDLDGFDAQNKLGLRPAGVRVSLLDLFAPDQTNDRPLLSFPSVPSPDEFVVFGTDGADVSAVVRLATGERLPGDLGLLLADGWLVLDFSARPFDDLEAERMQQVATALLQFLGQRSGT